MSTAKSNKTQLIGVEIFGWALATILGVVLFVLCAVEWLAGRVGLKLHLLEALDAQKESVEWPEES